MKLELLLSNINVAKIIGTVSNDAEVIPTLTPSDVNENSLLLCTRRLGGEYAFGKSEITKNPYALVTDDDFDADEVEYPVIKAENLRAATAHAFRLYHYPEGSEMKLIGVTGTNGKTTTATLIYHILNKSGIKCGFIGTGVIKSADRDITPHGYTMTTPDPDLFYKVLSELQGEGCEYTVIEVSSHSLALDKLAPISFECALFTNLSREHLDFHSSIDEYFRAKMKLFDKSKFGIFNVDDQYGESAFNTYVGEKCSVGIINAAENNATDISFMGLSGSSFLFHTKGAILRIATCLPGAFNIYNIMMAISCAVRIGVPLLKIKNALEQIDGVCGRMEVIHRNPTVIIDYAHTPKALENVLKIANSSKIKGQNIIIVFGCGGNRDKTKRPLMAMSAESLADHIIITEDNSRDEEKEFIFSDIISGLSDKARYTVIPDRADAIRFALSHAASNDIILIIGKGHEKYIIDADGYRDFDERSIVSDYYDEDKNEN